MRQARHFVDPTARIDLDGWYVFVDFCHGVITALLLGGGTAQASDVSNATIADLASFGEDEQGEPYALSLAGASISSSRDGLGLERAPA